MPAPANSLGRSSRARTVAIVAALVAVGVAARGREVQTPVQPPAPAPAPAVADSAAPDSSVADSTVQSDSLAMTDSAMMAAQAMPAPAAAPEVAAPATWPVDPATGQTLINGKPVVGRVFIMQKVDGLTKYENVAQVISREALAPQPAVVGSSHIPAPAANTRRMRGIMIQSTLWDMDKKRSAVEHRYYRSTTPASTLTQP